MLKPRYGTLAESIGDFNRMLDGMNKVQPLERKFTDDIQEMFTHEQKLVGLEKQIEHAHRVAAGSGLQMDVTESDNLAAMHAHAADMYGQAAVKAAEKVRDAIAVNNRGMAERFQGIVDRFREKAMEHQQQAKRSEKVVAESTQPKRSSIVDNFRVLAGIEERTQYPRDPGVLGTTRFNAGYEAMVECDCDDAHEKAEKKDFKKIKKATDDLDKMHKDVKESKQWAADAVKRPGRLHKHFGVPPDKKIPMSKIKAEYNRLKDKPSKSAEETSLMRALALGIRFKGGDVPGGEKKKGLAGD